MGKKYEIVSIQCGIETVLMETSFKDEAQEYYIMCVARGGLPRVRINGRTLLIWEAEAWSSRADKKYIANKYWQRRK